MINRLKIIINEDLIIRNALILFMCAIYLGSSVGIEGALTELSHSHQPIGVEAMVDKMWDFDHQIEIQKVKIRAAVLQCLHAEIHLCHTIELCMQEIGELRAALMTMQDGSATIIRKLENFRAN